MRNKLSPPVDSTQSEFHLLYHWEITVFWAKSGKLIPNPCELRANLYETMTLLVSGFSITNIQEQYDDAAFLIDSSYDLNRYI